MTVHLPTVSALSETGAPPKHVFALCCRRHHPESLRRTPSRSRGIRAQIYGPALETDLSPGVYNLATCMRFQMDVLPRRVTVGSCAVGCSNMTVAATRFWVSLRPWQWTRARHSLRAKHARRFESVPKRGVACVCRDMVRPKCKKSAVLIPQLTSFRSIGLSHGTISMISGIRAGLPPPPLTI